VKTKRLHPKNVVKGIGNGPSLLSLLLAFFIGMIPCTGEAVVNETPFAIVEADVHLPIPDQNEGRSLSHTLSFPGTSPIEEIEIAVRIDHPAVEELKIILITPKTILSLHNNTPSDQNPFSPIYEVTADSVDSLAGLIGTNPQGEWKIQITDTSNENTGTLLGWGIKMRPYSSLLAPPENPDPLPPEPITEQGRVSIGRKITNAIAADMNNDGMDDLILLAKDDERVLILFSNGLNLEEEALEYEAAAPQQVVVGDLNNDAKNDFIIARKGTTQTVFTVYLANEAGGFTKGFTAPVDTELTRIALVDINKDGIKDLILGKVPHFVLGVGDGSFHPSQPLILNNLGKEFWSHGDLNHDGTDDLIVTISRGGTSPNVDPHIILNVDFTDQNADGFAREVNALELEKFSIRGTYKDGLLAVPHRPGQVEFIALSDTGEIDPTWWFTSAYLDDFGFLHKTEVRLAGDLLSPPLLAQDINADGVDEILFANASGVMGPERQYLSDHLSAGYHSRKLFPRPHTRHRHRFSNQRSHLNQIKPGAHPRPYRIQNTHAIPVFTDSHPHGHANHDTHGHTSPLRGRQSRFKWRWNCRSAGFIDFHAILENRRKEIDPGKMQAQAWKECLRVIRPLYNISRLSCSL